MVRLFVLFLAFQCICSQTLDENWSLDHYPTFSAKFSTKTIDIKYNLGMQSPNFPSNFTSDLKVYPNDPCQIFNQNYTNGESVVIDWPFCSNGGYSVAISNAKKAGASSVFIVMSVAFQRMIYVPDVDVPSTYGIPYASISFDQGEELKSLSQTSNCSIQVRGSSVLADPAEKLALYNIFLQLGFAPNWFGLPIVLSNPSELLRNFSTVDPCQPRMFGITCRDSHIVEFTYIGYISGNLSAEINKLTSLEIINLQYNQMTGAFPDVSNLISLKQIYAQACGFNSVPSFNALIDLTWLSFAANNLKYFPDVPSLNQLQFFEFKNNLITNLPKIALNSIRYYIGHDNQIQDSIFSFKGANNLIDFEVQNNYIYSTENITTYFDDCSSLKAVLLNSNKLSGFLPNFVNSTKIKLLGLNNNKFIGENWGLTWYLPDLLELNLNDNQLTGISSSLVTSVGNIKMLRLRNNMIYNKLPLTKFFDSLEGLKIELMDLSSNKLQGNWDLSLKLPSTITYLNVSNNLITSVPKDIFNNHLSYVLNVVDMSNNNLTGSLNGIEQSPKESLVKLLLHNNPFYKSQIISTHLDEMLPNWVFQKTGFFKNEGQNYYCKNLGLALSIDRDSSKVTLDGSYFNFVAICECERGFYKSPPNCIDLPTFTMVLQSESIAVDDFTFGSKRLSREYSLKWEITSNPSPKQILLKFLLSKDFDPTDSLVIYDENSVVFKTNSQNNTSSLEMTFLMPKILLVFSSQKESGSMFYCNISFKNECPNTHLFLKENKRCFKVLERSEPIKIVVIVMSCIVTLISIFVGIIVYKKRFTLIIKSSSFPFCCSMILFLTILSITSIFYTLDPAERSWICHARPWCTSLSIVGVLGSLLLKADRIRKIFNSSELVVQAISNTKLAQMLMILLLGDTIILIVYSSLYGNLTIELGKGSFSNEVIHSCSSLSTKGYSYWLGAKIIYILLFLLVGCFEAWGIRKVPTAFNEGPQIASCLLSMAVLLSILLPLDIQIDENPSANTLIRGLGQALLALLMNFFFFGPKLFYILEGRENDKTLSSVQSKSGSSSSSTVSGSTTSVKSTA